MAANPLFVGTQSRFDAPALDLGVTNVNYQLINNKGSSKMNGSHVQMAASAMVSAIAATAVLAARLFFRRESLCSIPTLRTSGRIGFRALALDWLVEL
ncbi:hypothetical protein RAD16_28705 [Bradyrhizobium sp. 18BD]